MMDFDTEKGQGEHFWPIFFRRWSEQEELVRLFGEAEFSQTMVERLKVHH